MAIQMRRGNLADYDKNKMVSGEWGVSIDEDTNDQKAFIAFAPGVDKEVMFVEDAEQQIAIATAEAIDEATSEAESWAHGDGFDINDYESGDGTTTAFQLSHTPTTVIGVYVDGASTSAYTISDDTITFSSAPAVGQDNIRINYSVDTSQDNAEHYAGQASNSATTASNKASEAASSANTATNQRKQSEAWAVGTKDGVQVDEEEDQYNNNSKYYAQSASNSAGDASASQIAAAASADDAEYYAGQAEAAASMVDAQKILGNFASYEETTTASRAYIVGEYLTYNGYLYRVTVAIALGDTITVGTNVVQTNVGDEFVTIKTESDKKTLWWSNQAISSTSGGSGTLATITDARITGDHVLIKFVPANSSVITADVTCTTSDNGTAVLTGKSTAATTAEIVLERKNN